MVEKIINCLGLTVSMSLKAIETPAEKPLPHKDISSLGRKFICNYRVGVGMLSYLHLSTVP